MAGKQSGGGYEAELNRIRSLSDSIIPKTSALLNSLASLDRALSTVRLSDSWTGSAAEKATADVDEIRTKFSDIRGLVEAIDSAVGEGNDARRTAASAELPSASIDPFWANAAKGASFVIHPVLGPLAADTALDAIGDFMGNQREEAAKQAVENVQKSLVDPTDRIRAASNKLNGIEVLDSDDQKINDGGLDGPQINAPRIGTPGIPSGPSGYTPGGGGYQPGGGGGIGEYVPPVPTNPDLPTYPTTPTYPTLPDGPGNWEYDPDGPGGPGGPGGSDGSDPTVDFPGGGVLPGGPGGTGGGYPLNPGGSFPGGTIGGGGGGIGTGIGGGIGGVVGGGAGAAAIAAGTKIAGIGSMGALGGSGLGGASGAGLKAGGGLLGNSALGGAGGAGGAGGSARPGGIGGVGGAGGAGGTAGSSGAAGSGMRPGMGMMGGAGGADEEEKAKRSGLGGPVAPKLEDEEERGPRAKSAQAGSRDDHAE